MADFVQGDVVKDYVTVIDSSFNGITGVTWDILNTIDPDGLSFSLSISEVGNGVYRLTFSADKSGLYYWRIKSSNITPIQEFESEFTVSDYSPGGYATGVASEGTDLLSLIKMVATDLGDFLELNSTQNGSADGSTFVDELRLSAIPAATLKGSSFISVSPASVNYGQERRILDSGEENTILTFKPNFIGQFVPGDVGWVTNLHSKGFWMSQYISSINNAILKSHPRHVIPVTYTYPDVFSSEDPVIPIPQYITHIYSVIAENTTGQLWDIPFSSGGVVYGDGWSFDQSVGGIVIGGTWIPTINGWSVTLKGYGKPSSLVNLDDVTSVDPAWLVPTVAGSMRWSKGDQKRFPEASNFESRGDMWLSGSLTMTQPNTIRVR